jgi:uncharacterized protein YkwD
MSVHHGTVRFLTGVAAIVIAALSLVPARVSASAGDQAVTPAPRAGAESQVPSPLPSPLSPRPSLQALEIDLLERVNIDRAAHGLTPVAWDSELAGMARVRATDQLPLDRLSHRDGNGEIAAWKLLQAAGTRYRLAGENLARLPGADATSPARAQEALMNSPSHRVHILNGEYDSLAVGAAVDAGGRIVFVQLFRAVSSADHRAFAT